MPFQPRKPLASRCPSCSRFEPHIAEGLTQMFVVGTSTHKVGEVAQTLLGVAPSASTISRLNQTLTQQFETWREV